MRAKRNIGKARQVLRFKSRGVRRRGRIIFNICLR